MNVVRPGAHLDPFAFPPETNARFNLLVFGAVVTVLSLSITTWATITLGSNLNRLANLESGAPTTIENWRIVLFVVGVPVICGLTVATLLGLAYYKYRKHPEQIIMGKKLEPPKPERDQNFIQSIESLVQEAGLKTMPSVLLGPPRSQDGQAFGLRGRPFLRLGPNLKVMRLKNEFEPIYRAIILHEMAHIYNEDVQRSYFAEATWSALRIVTLPLAALIVLGYIPAIWRFGIWVCIPVILLLVALFVALELGIVFAMLQFIRRGALRVREIYADLRAAQWGAYAGLVQILSSGREVKRNWWQRLWDFHPKALERLKYLLNPERLFHITLDLPLSLGFLAGMILAGGSPILIRADQLRNAPGSGFEGIFGLITLTLAFLIYFSFLFLLAWLLAGGIGIQIQRQAVADWSRGINGLIAYLRFLHPALVFQLALEAGVYFMPYDYIQIDPSAYIVSLLWKAAVDPTFPPVTSSLVSFLVFPFWILFAALTLFVWMGLIRYFTRRLIASTPGLAPSFKVVRSITIIATLLLPFLYIPSAFARYWLLDITHRSILPTLWSLPAVAVLVLIGCLTGWVWLKSQAR